MGVFWGLYKLEQGKKNLGTVSGNVGLFLFIHQTKWIQKGKKEENILMIYNFSCYPICACICVGPLTWLLLPMAAEPMVDPPLMRTNTAAPTNIPSLTT